MYRRSVAAFIVDENNKILFCHRRDSTSAMKGFQVPQGGIENGESSEDALSREIEEEIGLSSYRILGKLASPIRYLWNEKDIYSGSPFVGQEQIYFMLRISSAEKLQIVTTADFDSFRWVDIDVLVSEVVDYKKSVYRQAYTELRHLIL
jgi:putative (di)nucleoside polyphosphate hydrolase